MKLDRMIELLEAEHVCMLRKSHGDCDSRCEACDLVQDDDELHEMYTKVIKVLKAETPKVLSLEELMGFDGAFLIEYNKSFVSLDPIWATFHFMDEKWVFIYKDVVISHYSVEQYGRTWRCWSRRPDPKQMEATPWPGA